MRRMLFLLTVTATPLLAQQPSARNSQQATADSVVAVAKRLFDGMRAHDSTMIASTFAPGAMMTGVPRPGRPVEFEPLTNFLIQAAKPGEPWNEQMFDPEVRIDGDFATLHTFYTFSLGDKPSHCGVDFLWLVRQEGIWKISAIADTRHKEGCEVTGRTRVP